MGKRARSSSVSQDFKPYEQQYDYSGYYNATPQYSYSGSPLWDEQSEDEARYAYKRAFQPTAKPTAGAFFARDADEGDDDDNEDEEAGGPAGDGDDDGDDNGDDDGDDDGAVGVPDAPAPKKGAVAKGPAKKYPVKFAYGAAIAAVAKKGRKKAGGAAPEATVADGTRRQTRSMARGAEREPVLAGIPNEGREEAALGRVKVARLGAPGAGVVTARKTAGGNPAPRRAAGGVKKAKGGKKAGGKPYGKKTAVAKGTKKAAGRKTAAGGVKAPGGGGVKAPGGAKAAVKRPFGAAGGGVKAAGGVKAPGGAKAAGGAKKAGVREIRALPDA